MKSEIVDDVGGLLAGLLGVMFGLALRASRRGRAASPPAIRMPAVLALSTLARTAGDLLGLERSNARARAVVSFTVGAGLAYFADNTARNEPSDIGSASREG